jgi:hypothetical protein
MTCFTILKKIYGARHYPHNNTMYGEWCKFGKIDFVAPKDCDFRKIPPKDLDIVKYYQKMHTLTKVTIQSLFPQNLPSPVFST